MGKALVIQLARFGDLVQSTRLLRTLVLRGETHLACDRSLAPLAGKLFPGLIVHTVRSHGAPTAEAVAENRLVFDELADLAPKEVYNLNYSGLSGALAGLFDPEIVRGHKLVRGVALPDRLTETAFRALADRRFSAVNLVDLWAHLADDPISPKTVNPPAAPKGRTLGVVLAGRESRRSLPPDILAPLVRTLAAARSLDRVTLLGSTAEQGAGRALLRSLDPKTRGFALDLCGKTALADLPEVMGDFGLLLTPDTGTMHLAAHLGVPTLATFLSSALCHETGPYGLGHTVLQARRDCAPCLESAPCPHAVACLGAFSDRGLWRTLATGKRDQPVPGLVVNESRFDALGVRFDPVLGEDPDAARRASRRRLFAEPLGVSLGETAVLADDAALLIREKDWFDPRLPRVPALDVCEVRP